MNKFKIWKRFYKNGPKVQHSTLHSKDQNIQIFIEKIDQNIPMYITNGMKATW